MSRRRDHPRGSTLAALVVLVVLGSPTIGCSRPERSAATVRSIDEHTTQPTTDTTAATPVTPSTRTPVPTPRPEPSGPALDTSERRAIVDGVLVRYDTALTALSADPAGAAATESPVRLAWDQVVQVGTALSDGLVALVVQRAQVDRVLVTPGPGGSSYRHHIDRVTASDDGSISFTWCGYSPGIGRDIDSGEIVDDAVAHSTGTGRVHPAGDTWVLDRLDELDLEILGPGASDPC